MPDWSYRTVFRPLLFCLPAEWARAIALGGIGRLAKLPGGGRVIDLMGHMAPNTELGFEKGGLRFPSRVGLGHLIDPTGGALAAMSRFGFGCIEVGPLDLNVEADQFQTVLEIQRQTIDAQSGNPAISARTLNASLSQRPAVGPPVLLRVAINRMSRQEGQIKRWLLAIERLMPFVDGIIIEYEMGVAWGTLIQGIARGKPVIWQVRSAGLGVTDVLPLFPRGLGILLDAPLGKNVMLKDAVRSMRVEFGPDLLLMARGHVLDPQDALDLRDAGADLVLIDEGLVFSGPGLAKRINEAELARLPIIAPPVDPRSVPESWVWTLLQGIALFGGGWLALAIAFSRVMLPYDEDFVGMNREQLCGVNPKLVDFMCHDRVTLAGTMISLGLCYSMLSIYGSRRGRHWAKVTIMASSFTGFFSFFAFLGYGYFDPFHAFVAAILFQFQLFGLAAPLSPIQDRVTPTLREDRPWRVAQWGQLFLICHAVALFTAGIVIVCLGSTSVFVAEDLEFMNTTRDSLSAANPRIIPLIAHDRASFGGMLLGCGLATLLPVLWGFERGRPWLWWMLLGAGVAGYIPAIGVHFAIGYINAWHLAPAFGGAMVLALGLALSRPYLSAGITPPRT